MLKSQIIDLLRNAEVTETGIISFVLDSSRIFLKTRSGSIYKIIQRGMKTTYSSSIVKSGVENHLTVGNLGFSTLEQETKRETDTYCFPNTVRDMQYVPFNNVTDFLKEYMMANKQ